MTIGIFLLFHIHLYATFVDDGTSEYKKGNYSEAINLYTKACDNGDITGCFHLGNIYFMGEVIKTNYFKAHQFWSKACNGGNMDGCYWLASLYSHGKGVSHDKVKAKELFGKACDGGNKRACESYQMIVTKKPQCNRDNQNNVVTDLTTNLEWQDNNTDTKTMMTWQYAMNYCNSLSLNGGDWRLPSMNELISIVDNKLKPTIDNSFKNTVNSDYWSSTTLYDRYAWGVSFSNGTPFTGSKKTRFYSRCVRTIQTK